MISKEVVNSIIERYINAKHHKCMRTAEARVRDLTRLYAEGHDMTYEKALPTVRRILEKY